MKENVFSVANVAKLTESIYKDSSQIRNIQASGKPDLQSHCDWMFGSV